MPKTTLNDLQTIIDEKDEQIRKLEEDLSLLRDVFRSLRILIIAMTNERPGDGL